MYQFSVIHCLPWVLDQINSCHLKLNRYHQQIELCQIDSLVVDYLRTKRKEADPKISLGGLHMRLFPSLIYSEGLLCIVVYETGSSSSAEVPGLEYHNYASTDQVIHDDWPYQIPWSSLKKRNKRANYHQHFLTFSHRCYKEYESEMSFAWNHIDV